MKLGFWRKRRMPIPEMDIGVRANAPLQYCEKNRTWDSRSRCPIVTRLPICIHIYMHEPKYEYVYRAYRPRAFHSWTTGIENSSTYWSCESTPRQLRQKVSTDEFDESIINLNFRQLGYEKSGRFIQNLPGLSKVAMWGIDGSLCYDG